LAGISDARICTATMVGETKVVDALFFDTSLIIAATVEAHPSHIAAADFVDDAVSRAVEVYVSPQVCREFIVVLTRQPVSGRTFTVDEAHSALSVWMTGCGILEESEAVLLECLDLARRHAVQGKQVHDCNIVATMRVHGVRTLATRNPSDFKRYKDDVSIVAIT
jgi:predicted nucleic acid-binding protein